MEVFVTFAAEYNLGKSKAATETAFSAVCCDTGDPVHQFILHFEKDVFWNNGLMGVVLQGEYFAPLYRTRFLRLHFIVTFMVKYIVTCHRKYDMMSP